MAGKIAIARGLARLALEACELRLDFADHVFQTGQICLRRFEAKFRLMPALMQSADAGGFFQNGAARQRLLADEKPDLALAHESGRARAGRSIGEKNLHVALAHVAAVYAIDAACLAFDAARHLDRVEIGIGPDRGAVGIVDLKRDFRDIAGRTAGAAGKNHIVHFAAADGGWPRLAHHPAHARRTSSTCRSHWVRSRR